MVPGLEMLARGRKAGGARPAAPGRARPRPGGWGASGVFLDSPRARFQNTKIKKHCLPAPNRPKFKKMTPTKADIELATPEDIADFSILDDTNPRSLVNIVPPHVKLAIRCVTRDLYLLDEASLKKRVKPTDTLNYLRLNFWIEYNRAQEKRSLMNMANVARGATTKEYMNAVVWDSPEKTAWVITPPTEYALVQADILSTGLARLRECLRVKLYTKTVKITGYAENGEPIQTTTTRPNIAAIREIRAITAWLADRVQGSVVQRLAVKQQTDTTVRGHLSSSTHRGPEIFEPDALAELSRTLQQVDKRLQLAEAAAPTDEAADAEIIDV